MFSIMWNILWYMINHWFVRLMNLWQEIMIKKYIIFDILIVIGRWNSERVVYDWWDRSLTKEILIGIDLDLEIWFWLRKREIIERDRLFLSFRLDHILMYNLHDLDDLYDYMIYVIFCYCTCYSLSHEAYVL